MEKTFEQQLAEAYAEQLRTEAIEKERRRNEFAAQVAAVDQRLKRFLPSRRVGMIDFP